MTANLFTAKPAQLDHIPTEGPYRLAARKFQVAPTQLQQAKLIAAAYPKCHKKLLKLPNVNNLSQIRLALLTRAELKDLHQIICTGLSNSQRTVNPRFIYRSTLATFDRCPTLVLRLPSEEIQMLIPRLDFEHQFIRSGFTLNQLQLRICKTEAYLVTRLKGRLEALDFILNLPPT